MNARKRKALDAMATGAPLYVYVEPSPSRLVDNSPPVGSGCILGDDGPMKVSTRIVAAIENLGTQWCPEYMAKVLTEDAILRIRGWYRVPDDTWLPR